MPFKVNPVTIIRSLFKSKLLIASQFILNILDLLLDGDEAGKDLRAQIAFLSDTEYDYTGVGLFVTFQSSEGIEQHRYKEDRIILDGVIITSPELGIGALATIFTSKGIIDYLEIWSYDGEYPKMELSNYTLKQESFGTGREISIRPAD